MIQANEYDPYRNFLYRTRNFHYDSLVMENTNRCTAKCAMCYLSAGENGKGDKLDMNVAKKCIREAAKQDCIAKRFHLAGGESFIYKDDCCELFACARKAGFKVISCTTNAFWSKKLDNARRVCEEIRKSGLTHMEISWDYWHYQFVSPETINNCLQACYENEIATNLRLLTTRSHQMKEVMDLLDPDAVKLAGKISCGQVAAVGRATKFLNEDDLYHPPCGMSAVCENNFSVTVSSKGFVAPCCAGLDQCDEYVNGNIYNESLASILKRMNRDVVLRRIAFLGIKSFFPIFKECGIEYRGKFMSPCKICAQVFSKKENIDAVRAYISRHDI